MLDQSGEPVMDCDKVSATTGQCESFVPLTLGRLIAGAVDQSEPGLKPEEVVARGTLALHVRQALRTTPPVLFNMDADNAALAKAQIVKSRVAPSVAVQAIELLGVTK
jgi:hypothetical protein